MKRSMLSWGLIAVAAMTLSTNCAKVEVEEITNEEPVQEEVKGTPFEIIAGDIETKTTNDGMSTKWESSDAINVFYADAGTTSYTSAGKFDSQGTGSSVTFKGTVGDLNDNNDWYAFYPYKSGISTPANTSTYFISVGGAQVQGAEATSTAHLCGERFPVYGKAENVAKATTPSITMKPAMSVVKVHVTNNSGAALTVNTVNFSTEDYAINGSFYIDFTGAEPVFTEKSGSTGKSSTLTVTGGKTIANLGTADFYIGITPFVAASGKKLTVKVNDYSKELTLSSAATFAAGKMKTLNFNYNETIDPAALPFSIAGTESAATLNSTDGVSYSNITPEGYAAGNAPYRIQCKNDGGYLQVFFDQAAAKVSFAVKMIGGSSTSHFDVKGSADGVSFTQIQRFTVSGDQNDVLEFETTNDINSSYRYIRIIFDKGSGSNVGLGPVSITKPSTAPEIQANNITSVAVTGTTSTFSYTIKNFADADDVEVSAVDGDVVTSAEVTTSGTVSYTVAANYGTGAANGSITLYSANEDVTKVVSVTQLGETFSTTATSTITLAKDDKSTTFTITTASFGWATTVTPGTGMDLSISPTSGSSNASAQTITINSEIAATGSEQTLGTIVVYRNGNDGDTQKKTITVKKAANASSSYTKVSSTPGSWAGVYLLCYGTSKVATDVAIPSGTKYYLLTTDVTVSENTITGNATIDGYAITVEALTGDDTGYYSIKFGTNKYLSNTGSNANFAAPPTSVKTDSQKWSFSLDAGGTVTITNKSSTRVIKWYSTDNQFRCYASSNTSPNPTLYKKN